MSSYLQTSTPTQFLYLDMCILAFLCLHRVVFVSHLLPARLSPRCTLRLRPSKTSVEPFKSRPYSSQPLLSSKFTSSRVLPPYTISDSLDSGSDGLSKISIVHRKALQISPISKETPALQPIKSTPMQKPSLCPKLAD